MYFLISNLMVPCYCFRPSPLILPTLEADISSSLQQSSKLSPGLSSTLCAKQPALTNILSHSPPTILAVPLSCSSQLPLPIGILNVHLSALLEPKLPHVDQVKRKKKSYTKSHKQYLRWQCAVQLYIQQWSWCTFVDRLCPAIPFITAILTHVWLIHGINTFTNSICQGVQEEKGLEGLIPIDSCCWPLWITYSDNPCSDSSIKCDLHKPPYHCQLQV